MPEALEITRQELHEIVTALLLRKDVMKPAQRPYTEQTLAKVRALLEYMGTCESIGIR